MKRLLYQQRPDESNTFDSSPVISPTKLFINNVSPLAKKCATKRLLTRGVTVPARELAGAVLENWPSALAPTHGNW